MDETLTAFAETQSTEAFALQNAKLLKVRLDQVTIQAKRGSMVAYQGDVTFEQFVNVSHDRKLYTTSTHGANARRFEVEDFASRLRKNPRRCHPEEP